MKDLHIVIPGGREVAYAEFGAERGPCLFFFHGSPMSRLHLAPLDEEFAARGLRVIAPDRPGFGRSSPHPGRTWLDWPDDVAGLADALGIDRFAVAGHSSGGAYAVVSAARLPDRVIGAALVAGVTDMNWSGAWDGYLEGRPELELMRLDSETDTILQCAERFGSDGSGFFDERFDLPEPDEALLADRAIEQSLTSALVEAFRQGSAGYAQDLYLEGHGWTFDPRGIAVRVDVVHGERDNLVPLAHSRHTSELIPGSTFRVLPAHGHLTILSELPEITAALVRAGDVPPDRR